MRLLYGTFNPAKIAVMREWLMGLDVELIGLSDLEKPPAEADENGITPLDNARIKADAYHRSTGMPTLSADSALYLNGIPESQQPGVHARRVDGRRFDDEEMIMHYAAFAHELGGQVMAQYRNAVVFIHADGRQFERFDDSLASKAFYLVDTPHVKRTKGFPLDSLSVEIESGKYYFDISKEKTGGDLAQENGFRRFVQEVLSQL